MKKFFLALVAATIFVVTVSAATGDTTIIMGQINTNLTSPPKDYDNWVVFPNNGVSYQKILMKVTIGCGTPACSHWDYTVNAQLGKKSGTEDSAIASIDTLAHDTTWNYTQHVDYTELGRLITPYGNYMDWGWPANQRHGFDSSWTHPYVYDVTDYASLFKDSVSVRVHYDGWSDAFRASVEFIFIEGPPTHTVESVREIYHTSTGYASSADFENAIPAKTFSINPSVTSAKVTVIMTGHGGSGEFDPHYIHLMVNGTEVSSRFLWKEDCDYNPVSPQGGTWILHRSNWCPGDKVPVFEFDITPFITPGQNVSVQVDLDNFTPQPNGYSYIVSAYLVTYSAQKDNDAMMEEIIAPNSDKPYLHWNPSCTMPKVKIKNMGKNLLTYAEIAYWVKRGNKWYYEWNGALPTFQSEIITLPAFDFSGMDTTDREFNAEVKWPNQVPDEYAYNNQLTSSFNMTPQMDSTFYIYFKSNNQPWEDSYVVRNEDGDTISHKTNFAATTIYRDTLRLAPGSYAFDFYDYDANNWGCGDGLQFWANQPPNAATTDPWYETTGILRLMKMNNTIVRTFDGDFGANVHYEFTVGHPLGYNTPKTAPSEPTHNTGIVSLTAASVMMNVFPNPANEQVNIEIDLNKDAAGVLEMTDISGRMVRQMQLDNSSHHFVTIPSGELSKGIYFVNFISEGIKVCRKVVVQ